MAKSKPELAHQSAIHRTIPKKYTDVPVTAASSTVDLTPYGGQFIWLKGVTLDVTIRLGTAIDTAGNGYVLSKDATVYEEFFIDPTDDLTLHHRSTGVATLRILSD